MNKFIYADFIGSYVNICVAQLILQHIVAVFLNKSLLAQTLYVRPLKNAQFCSSSRKAIRLRRINHPDEIGTGIHTLSILRIALKLHCVQKFEPDTEIGQKGAFCKGLNIFEKPAPILLLENFLCCA